MRTRARPPTRNTVEYGPLIATRTHCPLGGPSPRSAVKLSHIHSSSATGDGEQRDALEQAPGAQAAPGGRMGACTRPAWAMGLGQRWGWPRPRVGLCVLPRVAAASQWGVKSWLLPAAFLQDHWSSCWPVLLLAPKTSRHRPLPEFLNSQEPSDCCIGSHWLLADPFTGCCTMSGVPAAVALPDTVRSSPEFCACSSPEPPEVATNWNCWLAWPLQVHWSIAAPAAAVLPDTSRHSPSLPIVMWWYPPGKALPPDWAGVT